MPTGSGSETVPLVYRFNYFFLLQAVLPVIPQPQQEAEVVEMLLPEGDDLQDWGVQVADLQPYQPPQQSARQLQFPSSQPVIIVRQPSTVRSPAAVRLQSPAPPPRGPRFLVVRQPSPAAVRLQSPAPPPRGPRFLVVRQPSPAAVRLQSPASQPLQQSEDLVQNLLQQIELQQRLIELQRHNQTLMPVPNLRGTPTPNPSPLSLSASTLVSTPDTEEELATWLPIRDVIILKNCHVSSFFVLSWMVPLYFDS